MSKIIMLDYTSHTGKYKSGPNAGKDYSIANASFAGPSGRIVKRIIPNLDAAKAFKGEKVGGTLVEADVQPYSFKDASGKDITTSKKWLVQFEGESLEAAARAHGKKLALAQVVMQPSADVAV